MPNPRIWTEAARTLLFEELTRRFEPYRDWQQETQPGRGLNEEYKQFLRAFADLVGVTPEAVALQIAFAIQKRGRLEPSQSRQHILNVAAAYHAGFIQDFPHLIILDRELAGTASPVALDLAAARMSLEQ